MTDQKRAAALADQFEDGSAVFFDTDLIVRALRLLAEYGNAEPKQGNGAAVLPCFTDLRETVNTAIFRAQAAMSRQDPADAVLSAISAAGYVIVPREPTEAMENAFQQAIDVDFEIQRQRCQAEGIPWKTMFFIVWRNVVRAALTAKEPKP
jgi:hypothetical protein